MTEVHHVTVQLRGSSPSDPGQVTDGYYIIDDGMVVMTHPDGNPVDEYMYRAPLRAGDSAIAIASVLTKQVRRGMMGLTEEQDAFFSRKLNYPKAGVA